MNDPADHVFCMRKKTLRAIDALHAQIRNLIAAELTHHDSKNPTQNKLRRHIAHTCIELARHCPEDRVQMRFASAVLPKEQLCKP